MKRWPSTEGDKRTPKVEDEGMPLMSEVSKNGILKDPKSASEWTRTFQRRSRHAQVQQLGKRPSLFLFLSLSLSLSLCRGKLVYLFLNLI